MRTTVSTRLRRAVSRWAPPLAAALLALSPITASAAGRCAGNNMLDELRVIAPDLASRVAAEAASTINAGAVLWKIERGGIAPSYLLGTIHLTDERVTAFSPRLTQALDEVGTVALEVADVSAEATQAAMAKSGNLTLLGAGQSLDKLLAPAEFQTLTVAMARAGVPEPAARMFRPWVATLIMSVSDCERRKVNSGEPVLDARIAEVARRSGKRIVGLETIESQLAALSSIPESEQLQMLRVNIAYAHRTDDQMETLLQLYTSRNIAAAWPAQVAFAERVGIGREAFTAFEKSVVTERNETMTARALPLLAKGRTLIAVGALHLPGARGIVNLLRQAGYTLTPLE
ncbi:MAG: TraB/GumN family protein [Hyphomicrobiaceae bacterium]